MDLERVSAALAPTEVVGAAPIDIADLAYDARRARAGSLFFCIPGASVDGHDFAREAVANGAAALVVERPLDLPVPQLVVADARSAMALAADEFFGRPTIELQLAGVTGTNGKTTTAHLLYAILAASGRRPGLIGTVERRVGGRVEPAVHTTPEAIDLQRDFRRMLDAGDRSCALEASSHAAALRRLDRVRFDALVFTNLTQDHLDFHGTMDAYFAAKRRLFLAPDRPPAALNVDDVHGRRLAAELRGAGAGRDLRLRRRRRRAPRGLELDTGGSRFRAVGIDLETRLRGRFNVLNVLGAVAASLLLGVDGEAAARGIEEVAGVPGRFEVVEAGSRSPSSSTTRTRRTPWRACSGRRGRSQGGGSWSCSAAEATATVGSARRWGGSPRRSLM